VSDPKTLIHVIPKDDQRKHVLSMQCWCRPTQGADERFVVIHYTMDARELYTDVGERKLH